MDLTAVIQDLRSQLGDLNEAIFALEKMAYSQPKRPGRPRVNLYPNPRMPETKGMVAPAYRPKTLSAAGN